MIKTVVVSDISGVQLKDSERVHLSIFQGKRLDAAGSSETVTDDWDLTPQEACKALSWLVNQLTADQRDQLCSWLKAQQNRAARSQ